MGQNRYDGSIGSDRSRHDRGRAPSDRRRSRPSVGILVDLALTETAGGHVRFWHNIARAAAEHGCEFDLTFHFQSDPRDGARNAIERHTVLSDEVRIVTLPPVFSTARMRFLDQNPDHTDLAPHHPALAKHLESYDILHTTDAYFAYAKTACRIRDPDRQALVSSIHTDTPAYTRVYSKRAFRKIFRNGRLSRLAIDRWRWPERAEARMHTSLARHLSACRQIWFAPSDDPTSLSGIDGSHDFDVLQRGLDWRIFSPDRRDRDHLLHEFDIDEDNFVLCFAGRLDIGKEVMIAAQATRALLDRGQRVKLILAGLGRDTEPIRNLLGSAVRLPGFVDQRRLGWILASSDAFVFPSRIETAANAVIEARASGLPVFASQHVARMLIREDGVDGVIVDTQTPEAWANAIEKLVENRDLARKMGALASTVTAQTQPSWHQVLVRELVPGWSRSLCNLGVTD